MKPRIFVVVIGLGVGSFIAMGLMAKYLFDSNPDLKKVSIFKRALAEQFADRGALGGTTELLTAP